MPQSGRTTCRPSSGRRWSLWRYRLQKPAAVQRHVVKVVGDDRLRRAAEADLIRHHYAEAFLAQNRDRTGKVESAKIHAMKQHHRAAVGLPGWRHIHVRHAHILTVYRQRENRRPDTDT